jgi:uncharacterized protein YqeY
MTPEQEAEAAQLRASTVLTEPEERAVLLKRVKQHRQSIDGFRKGNRTDLVDAEEAQLGVATQYLPEGTAGDGLPADIEDAIQAAISESGAQTPRDQGKVMGLLSARLRGRADMRDVAARVQELLAGR